MLKMIGLKSGKNKRKPMKKLLSILVLGLLLSGNAYADDLPRLFGVKISDKFYNYNTADKPLKNDRFSVQIFPPTGKRYCNNGVCLTFKPKE